jgi:chaperonin GroES
VSPAACPDPRPGSVAGLSFVRGTSGYVRALPRPERLSRSISEVPDPKFEIQMLHDRVMIKIVEGAGERRSSAGIVIPAPAQVAKRLVWGEVAGVGQHVRTVKPGDRVLLAPDDQYEVEVQGTAYLVMRERDLHAVATERTEHGTGLYL